MDQPVSTTRAKLDELCNSADRRVGADLFFFRAGTLARIIDSEVLRHLMREFQTELLLLEENDPAGPARDDAEVCLQWFFSNHAHGDPEYWGWQPGASLLRKILPEQLVQPEFHLVWDCEAALLLLGEFDSVAMRIRELTAPTDLEQGLRLLWPHGQLAFGRSAHSGDFLWRPQPT